MLRTLEGYLLKISDSRTQQQIGIGKILIHKGRGIYLITSLRTDTVCLTELIRDQLSIINIRLGYRRSSETLDDVQTLPCGHTYTAWVPMCLGNLSAYDPDLEDAKSEFGRFRYWITAQDRSWDAR